MIYMLKMKTFCYANVNVCDFFIILYQGIKMGVMGSTFTFICL